MNTEKMIPIDFSRNITPFIIGDVMSHAAVGSFTLETNDQVNNFNNGKLLDGDYYIVSFANRPNTGTQPVGDDVSTNALFDGEWIYGSRACIYGWHLDEGITKWKPNHAAMLKQFKEQGANTMRQYNDQEAELATHYSGNNNRFYIRGHSMVKKAMVLNNDGHWIYGDCTRNDELDGGEFWKLNGNQVIEPWVADQLDDLINPVSEGCQAGDVISVPYSELPPCNGEIPKSVFTQEVELLIGGGKNVPEVYKAGRFVYHGSKYSIFVTGDGKEYSRKNSKIKTRPIDNRSDEERLRDAVWESTELRARDGAAGVVSRLLSSDKFTITLNKD